ncbi:MAG TPA: hypothetical protein VGC93_18685 [Thermoanaerobaculia bacterium]
MGEGLVERSLVALEVGAQVVEHGAGEREEVARARVGLLQLLEEGETFLQARVVGRQLLDDQRIEQVPLLEKQTFLDGAVEQDRAAQGQNGADALRVRAPGAAEQLAMNARQARQHGGESAGHAATLPAPAPGAYDHSHTA